MGQNPAKLIALVGALALTQTATADQLKNGNFEAPAARELGNNIGTLPTYWTVERGNTNLVKVDGPGGHDYGSNAGPDQDADGDADEDNWKQYLDIQGNGFAYQSFRSECSGEVQVRGVLSPRVTGGGTGTISLLRGGSDRRAVASSGTVSIPAKTGASYTWTPVEFTATVERGEAYTYRADLDNNLNLDNAAVICNPVPEGAGMTFGIADPYPDDADYPQPVTGTLSVGCRDRDGVDCDPRQGDTACSVQLPILCINPMGLPKPASVEDRGRWHHWTGGIVGTTAPTTAPGKLSQANEVCKAEFGDGWRVAQFHEGLNRRSGWSFQAYGNVGTQDKRFWVDIDDQRNGVCWDRSK